MAFRAETAPKLAASAELQALPLIVHVVYRLDIGGLETVLVELINHTGAKHFRHAIVCLAGYTEFRERIRVAGVECYSLHKRPGKDPAMYWRLWKLLRRLRPALVQTYNVGCIDSVVPATLAGVRAIVHAEHGREAADPEGASIRYNRMRRWLSPLIRRYVTVSRDLDQWLTQTVGIPPAKVEHIYNGVDLGRYSPRKPGAARQLLSDFAPDDALVLGTVGRLDSVKDHATLVRAFASLVSQSADARARLRLVIVGGGPEAERLQNQIAAAGLEPLIRLTGPRNDVPQLLREMDIFVSSSIAEGIALTILEAMACAVPVVATEVGGNPELVVPDRTGLLVPPSQPDAMAAALHRYLDDPTLIRRHGEAGRERVESLFSIDAMIESYINLYHGMLTRQRGEKRMRS